MSKLVKFDKKYATKRDLIPSVNRDLKEVFLLLVSYKSLGRGSQLCVYHTLLNCFEGVLRFPQESLCLFHRKACVTL